MTQVDDLQTKFRDEPIGEIAARLPGAMAIFRKLKLDYCCGGAISLGAALKKRGLVLADVERQLAALTPQESEIPESSGQIIDHLISRYHETHRRELPELIELARRVERVHAGNPEAPAGLADFLIRMDTALGTHMQQEELILFPMIRAGDPMVSVPISAMVVEHLDHGDSLEALATLTHDMEPPEGACGTWRALYAGVRKLSDDLTNHIHIENNILFPRFPN